MEDGFWVKISLLGSMSKTLELLKMGGEVCIYEEECYSQRRVRRDRGVWSDYQKSTRSVQSGSCGFRKDSVVSLREEMQDECDRRRGRGCSLSNGLWKLGWRGEV